MRGELLAMGVLFATACAVDGAAPPNLSELGEPEVLFLVKNEVMAIRLDGTGRRSLGRVGHDQRRTGFPRLLPDSRVAVLGDETGAIFPYVSQPFTGGEGGWRRMTPMNVTLHDALCGVTIFGESRLVFTATPFTPFLPMSARMYRMDPDTEEHQAVAFQVEGPSSEPGALSHPAPYADGRVLAVRTLRPDGLTPGISHIEILSVERAFDHDQLRTSERLATLEPGYLASSPARLPDGRVVFIRSRPGDPSPKGAGEIMVISRDNQVLETGIVGVVALVTVGPWVVYEAGGGNEVSDLVATDLASPPRNVTQTRFVSEHLGWSD